MNCVDLAPVVTCLLWPTSKCIEQSNVGIICCGILHVLNFRDTSKVQAYPTHASIEPHRWVHTSFSSFSSVPYRMTGDGLRQRRKKRIEFCKHILNFSSHICRYISIQLTSIVYDPLTKMHITTVSEMNTGGTFINFCTWLRSIFSVHALILQFSPSTSLCAQCLCGATVDSVFSSSNFIDVMWF